MTSNSVKVYKPKVTTLDITAFAAANENYVSDIRLEYGLGSLNTCHMLLQPAQGKAGDVQLMDTPTAVGAYTSAIKLVADHIASRGTGLDVSVSVDTGQTAVGFKGYITDAAPSYGLRENGVKLGVSGPEAILSTVSPQIYSILYARREDITIEDGAGLSTIFTTALKEFTASLVTEGTLANFYPDSEKATIENMSASNKPGLDFLNAVFSNTESKTWDTLLAGTAKVVSTKDLVLFVMGLLSTTPPGSFAAVLRVIGDAFGLLYVPDADNFGPGKLVDIVEVLEQEPAEVKLDMDQVQFFVNPAGIITPRRVSVLGKVAFNRRSKVSDKTPVCSLYSQPVVAVYPEGDDDGFTLPVPTPPWWKAYYRDDPVSTSGTYKIENIRKFYDRAKESSEERRENSLSILEYWAKIAYTKKIGNTVTASVSGLPLSGGYTPGTKVRIVSEEGGVLGTGLITKAQHNLSVGSNKVDAGTHLTLSYVTF